MDLQLYLKRFPTLIPWDRVSSISDLGVLKANTFLIAKIRNRTIAISEIDALLKEKKYDVRTDDLIKIFEVTWDDTPRYVFIYEYLDVFTKDYLIEISPVG